MKRKPLPPKIRKTLLAVPAAALMLGAAQAGTTVGLNFQAWYYDSGVTPQTVGYGAGYQTTGFPVTAKAFGVAAPNWFNTDPLDCQSAIATSVSFAGTLTAQITAPNAWQSGIGALNAGWVPETVLPGNDEATWGYLDDGNANGSSPSVVVSGLASKFPNGYVVQTIAANGGVKTYNSVDITDGVTTNTVAYTTYYVPSSVGYDGTVGLSAGSAAFTSGTININCQPKTSGNRSTLAAFVITDQPVISKDPVSKAVNLGASLTLTASAIGLPNSLSYQWRHAGTNLPGATSATYTQAVTTANDAGDYDLVVTNLYGAATSAVASITINAVPSITKNLAGVTGTVYAGANFAQWSVAASGAQPLHYQWLKNGATPVGTDSPTLTLTNVSVAASGDYSVTITNIFSSAKSATNHLTVVTSPNLYTTDVAKDAPGAYWPLNELTGPEAKDYSGAAHSGTNNGGLTLGAVGPRPPSFQGFDAGKVAYQFDGSSSYIDCGTGPSVSGTNDFTLEAWINTSVAASGMILQQRYASGFDGEYMFNVTASGTLRFMVYGGGYQFDFATTRTVNDGIWHHVVAVRSGTNGFIYIDGTQAANATGPVRPLDATFTTVIGRDQRDLNTYFNGSISDVAIYPVALSVHSITLHAYHGRLGNASFALSVVPGGFVEDTKPLGTPHLGVNNNAFWSNSITDANSPTVTRTGVEAFAGNSQIVAPADADFNSPNGTIAFWVRADAPIPGPGNEAAILFDRRTTNGAIIGLKDDGSIAWQGQAGSRNEFSAGYVPDNNWHHIAVTYGQTTSDTLSIYIDGLLAGSTAVTNAWSWPAAQQIELGRSHDTYWKALNGQLDDFRIYNRVLTAPEVAALQSSGAIVDAAALKVRYNFDAALIGSSLTWPVGALESSPTVGPSAIWTPVPNAVPPYPFLPPAPAAPAGSALFYRAGF